MSRKTKYKNIGRTATPEKFLKEFKDAADSMFLISSLEKRSALIDGALEAFCEGRPENIQAFMPQAKDIYIKSSNNSCCSVYTTYILFKIAEGSKDLRSDIELALEKSSGVARQDILQRALVRAVGYGFKTEEHVAALLDVGAQATGEVIAYALDHCPPSTIMLLHERGGSFDEALSYMEIKDYPAANKERMKFYQSQFEETGAGNEPVVEVKTDILLQMQEQIRELTERVTELTEELRSQKAPANDTAVVKKQAAPYPSLKYKH